MTLAIQKVGDRAAPHGAGQASFALEREGDRRFKRAWKDGSTAVDLLAQLCALIPRMNMVRYHGVLSAHAKLRAEVLPEPAEPEPDPLRAPAIAAALRRAG